MVGSYPEADPGPAGSRGSRAIIRLAGGYIRVSRRGRGARQGSELPGSQGGGHAVTQDGPVSLDRYSAPQWLGAKATRRFHVMA